MSIEIIIFTALIEMSLGAWYINGRILAQGAIQTRIHEHVVRDTMQARNPQAMRSFMKMPARTTPRINAHAGYANQWPDMAQSIADDVHITYYN